MKGRVVDSNGEGVIGGNVMIEGSCRGSIRDIDGVFMINGKGGRKLRICFMGYEWVRLGGKGNMRVRL